MTREDITIFLLLIGEAVGVFSLFCPSWHDVSTFEGPTRESRVKRTRAGMLAASVVVVGTGAAIMRATGKLEAFYVGVVVTGVIVAGYEAMISNPLGGVE